MPEDATLNEATIVETIRMAMGGSVHQFESDCDGTITLYYTEEFKTYDGYYSVIGHRTNSPWENKPFFSCIWRPERGNSWISGWYDLTIEEALKARKQRAR